MPTQTLKAIYTTAGATTGTRTDATPACCCPACAGLTCLDRTRFFAGQLLTDADLNNEQSYWLAKSRLHNRYLHGWGVVCGMTVLCGECDGWVTVKAGYALDPCGNDIIVCQDYPFNLIQAINACCAPPKTAANCSPLRYTPSPTCQDTSQTWCVTIQYQEQQSRLITPLQQATTVAANCSCGCPTSSNQTGSTSSATTAACQATRIIEGFQIGVTPAQTTGDTTAGTGPGTMVYQFTQCLETAAQLVAQSPYPAKTGIPAGTSYQQAYQAVCNYLQTVLNAVSGFDLTHCEWLDNLASIVITAPTSDGSGNLANLGKQLDDILLAIAFFAFECLCTAWMPPCPAAPCDNRLILACVTVQGGKIVDICHFGGGRQQVVTFPSLYYWLSFFGADTIVGAIINNLQSLCCALSFQRDVSSPVGIFNTQSVALDRLSNPAQVNQFMNSAIAQKLGAAILNATSTTSKAVDLRPLVGQTKDVVSRALASYQIGGGNANLSGAEAAITWTDVSADPAWNDDAVASSTKYAPAAFDIAQPLTVFSKGNLVVGFQVTDPSDVLNSKVASLQAQVAHLTDLVNRLQPQTGAVPAPAPPVNPPPK